MSNVWFVSRQHYVFTDPEDALCVEIAGGGINYANADMLVEKYQGEGLEYKDPREAVRVAIAIAKAWQADAPNEVINVAAGCTGGDSIPFEGQAEEDLIAWAEETYAKLEKCPKCGEIMEGATSWHHAGTWYGDNFEPDEDDGKFCSECCAEKASMYACQGDDCGNVYTYEERKKLSDVNDTALCPVCRQWPCDECGETAEDCEDHEFAPMAIEPYKLKYWQSTSADVPYLAIWPDGSFLGIAGDGTCYVGEKAIFDPETTYDESMGRKQSVYGYEVNLDELSEKYIKLVMDELKARIYPWGMKPR